MADYKAVITLSMNNFTDDGEAKEGINMLLEQGFESFNKNYANILGKMAVVSDIKLDIVIPDFRDMDTMMMAKVISRYLTREERANGVFDVHGDVMGAYYVVSNVLIPMLERFKINHLFSFFMMAGSTQVLVQDINDEPVINFESVPSSLMDIANFAMKIVTYYRDNEQSLKQYLIGSVPTEEESNLQEV